MNDLKVYRSYNQITKLFDVVIMTKNQISKLDTNQYLLVLKNKKGVNQSPRKTRGSKKPTLRELIVGMSKRLEKIEAEVSNIKANQAKDHTLLKEVITLNNLKTK